MLRGYIERNVDASLFKVARNVLPKIGELQSGARRIGKFLTGFVVIPAKIEHQPADRIRGVDAVVKNGIPGAVALDDLVFAKGF